MKRFVIVLMMVMGGFLFAEDLDWKDRVLGGEAYIETNVEVENEKTFLLINKTEEFVNYLENRLEMKIAYRISEAGREEMTPEDIKLLGDKSLIIILTGEDANHPYPELLVVYAENGFATGMSVWLMQGN